MTTSIDIMVIIIIIITARQHSFYAERCISYSKSVRPSVRPSVRHTLALSQNDSSYDHGVFTGG